MLDLIKYIVGQFAEDKENIEYVVTEKERVIEVNVILSPSDMGKVIGKQGRIAKSIRTVVKAAASQGDKKVIVDIK